MTTQRDRTVTIPSSFRDRTVPVIFSTVHLPSQYRPSYCPSHRSSVWFQSSPKSLSPLLGSASELMGNEPRLVENQTSKKIFWTFISWKNLCLLWYFYLSDRSSVAAVQTGVVVDQMGDAAGWKIHRPLNRYHSMLT